MFPSASSSCASSDLLHSNLDWTSTSSLENKLENREYEWEECSDWTDNELPVLRDVSSHGTSERNDFEVQFEEDDWDNVEWSSASSLIQDNDETGYHSPIPNTAVA